jgi:hypothetical protein
MAEQDTQAAQATDQDNTSGQVENPQDNSGDNGNAGKQKPFTPDQEQYLGSWMGRIIAKQLDEKVLPHIRQPQQVVPQVNQDDAMKKYNEEVQNKIFSGDAVGAVEMVLNLKEKAKQNLSQMQNMNLLRGLTTYADQPYYEDIHPAMQNLAKEKIAEGWPVEAALKASYSEAKASFLETKLTSGDRENSGLSLSGGGRQSQRSKVVKLPPAFEAQCNRDISDGIYKNREEWIKALSPKVRERIGI